MHKGLRKHRISLTTLNTQVIQLLLKQALSTYMATSNFTKSQW